MRSRHPAIALVAGVAVTVVTGLVSVPVWAAVVDTAGPGTATVACTAPAWAAGTHYAVGDQVTYQGHLYQARIAHTPPPGAGWTPAAVPALWQDLGTCSGGTPPTSPSPTPSATPTPSSTSPPPTSTSPPPTSPPPGDGMTWHVTDAAGLSAALAGVSPGDTISLAPGDYTGTFYTTRSGTASQPIMLTGPASAVLSNSGHGCDPNVPDQPSGISYCGYGLHLNHASYWYLTGFTVTDSAKGIVLDASSHNIIADVEVSGIGDEGVHFRTSSSDNVLEYSRIHDTGQEQPGYGEGLYFGSARSNWDKYGTDGGSGMDLSNGNQAIGNVFGPNIAAEHIDIKEGTTGGLVVGNTFDGRGISGANSADSWVDVKGNGYLLIGNHGTFSGAGTFADGYQTHQIVAPYGCGNVWRDNDSDLGGVGVYAIHVTDNSRCGSNLNVVYGDNTVSNATGGLTNIGVTVG